MMNNPEEVERTRAEYEERAVGGREFGVAMISHFGTVPIFYLDPASADVQRLYALAREHPEMDQGGSFALFWQGDKEHAALALTLDWEPINTEIVLYLPLMETLVPLKLIHENEGNLIISRSHDSKDWLLIQGVPHDEHLEAVLEAIGEA
jgi:hypothetical protein